jgi:serine/threonine-protein kinase
MTPDVGSRLGPYEISARLGAGGMGEVFRARDPRLGRDVAVKVLSPASAADPDRLRRFEREARAVAALSHPNIVAIFDIGLGDVPFLVTELLDGETLRARIARGKLTPEHAIHIMLQLAAGLAAAHARGIVHRDLKPENVFLTTEGPVKILDFGLAKQIVPEETGDDGITRSHTLQGIVLGTIGYMAPEQVRGLEADHRADVFACGAILYELLTGRRAFLGPTGADTLSAILSEPPSRMRFDPDTPPALVRVVRRCLEKEASERFQSMRDLASALEAVSDLGTVASQVVDAARPASVAILPFANLSADAENEYFSDGLAEELVNALTRLSGLRVASPTSSFRFRGRQADIRSIGHALGVGAVVEGSVRRAGNRLRLIVQLTSTEDGYHLWSERYDREIDDVFEVQDEIVASIVRALAPALLGEAKGAVRRGTENLQAYDLYLRGRHLWNQRSPAVFGKAIHYFEQAIALDADYALAYAGLADCYSILRVYGWTPFEHSQPRAHEAVTRALALDPELPEAHFAHALYTFYFERHWRSARRHFVAALELSPRVAMFHAYFGLFLATEYDYEEARRRIDRALALDPYSSLVHFLVASTCCVMGDGPATVQHAAQALDLQPEALGPRWPQTVGLLMEGHHEDAIMAAEQVVARTRAPIYVGVLGMVYARAGRLAEAHRLARELEERRSRGEYVVPAAPLSLHLGLGDPAAVHSALEACVDGGAAPFSIVATDRWLLDAYRGDARFDPLLDRLHDGARPPVGSRLAPAGDGSTRDGP